MTRNKKLLLNVSTGLLKQLIVIICGFILPRYMILYYGSSVNGLVSSITHFLGFIALLELGIGPVIQANLYEPLAKKDNEQISKVIISSEKFFRGIAYIFLIYIVTLIFVFPNFINTEYNFWFTTSLLLIISISTFAQYYFGATYQLLLNADQKSYVQTTMQIVTVVLNTVFAVILMKCGASIQLVKLLTAAIYVLRPIGQIIYVKKNYSINKKYILTEEPIKQKWNGFSQHLSSVICANVDVVVLSLFSTLANVSIYSVYFNVTNGVTAIIMTAATGLEAYFGNMLAKNEKNILLESFKKIEWIIHTGVTLIFTITAITLVPFISVYTNGINDANYIVPTFGVILTLAYAMQCLRVPYFRIIKAAGHFKQTQNGSFISAGLNVIISVLLVFKLGLVGIALGTLVAMLYHTCYFVWYLKKNILNRPLRYFIYYLISDTLIYLITVIFTKNIILTELTYIAWFSMAIKVGVITVAVSSMIKLLIHHKEIFGLLRNKYAKK